MGYLRLLALFVAMAAACGCVSRMPADPERLSLAREAFNIEHWPDRLDECELYDGDHDQLPPILQPIGRAGRGYLYRATPWRDAAHGESLLFISARTRGRNAPFDGPRLVLDKSGPDAFEIVLKPNDMATIINIARADSATQRRGVAVYLTSLAGFSRPERALIRRLRAGGWDVLSITPSSHVIGGNEYPHVINPEQIERGAAALASRMDDLLAESAYAAEAGLAYLAEEIDLADGRYVLIGSSFGAMSAPAVAAAMPDRFDAAVLIAGGANLLEVLTHSPLSRHRLTLLQTTLIQHDEQDFELLTEMVDADTFAATMTAALEASQLDAWHAAAALANMPVLLLHARFDHVVPARLGDQLYERLGRPERWTYATGHFGLFFLLNVEAARVARWIDNATEQR